MDKMSGCFPTVGIITVLFYCIIPLKVKVAIKHEPEGSEYCLCEIL